MTSKRKATWKYLKYTYNLPKKEWKTNLPEKLRFPTFSEMTITTATKTLRVKHLRTSSSKNEPGYNYLFATVHKRSKNIFFIDSPYWLTYKLT